MVINTTGEEGVQQMRSLLGLRDLVTNVNIPNYGQIPICRWVRWWKQMPISARIL